MAVKTWKRQLGSELFVFTIVLTGSFYLVKMLHVRPGAVERVISQLARTAPNIDLQLEREKMRAERQAFIISEVGKR